MVQVYSRGYAGVILEFGQAIEFSVSTFSVSLEALIEEYGLRIEKQSEWAIDFE